MKVSQIIVQGRCISNKYAPNVKLICDFLTRFCPGSLNLGFPQLLHFLLTTSTRFQKGAGFNKRAGRIVSPKVNQRAGSN